MSRLELACTKNALIAAVVTACTPTGATTATSTGGSAASASSSSQSSANASSSGNSSSSSLTPPDAGRCGALENDAPEVTFRGVVGDVPAMDAGTIRDGIYHLVDFVYYGDGGVPSFVGQTLKETYEIRAAQYVTHFKYGISPNSRIHSGAYRFVDGTYVDEQTCP